LPKILQKMTNNFTIKVVQVQTNSEGVFSIQPVNDSGYNILPVPYTTGMNFPLAAVVEADPAHATTNSVFENLVQMGLSMDEISRSAGTRLFGLNQFKAVDGALIVLSEAEVSILVVVWNT
jgi:hypothetical protein